MYPVTMLFKSVLALIFVQEIRSLNIGIVGGGIGGTSAAYHLRQLFKNKVHIDLYEQFQIGGRLATISIDEDEYEVGGSIIHERNKHARELMKAMNLSSLRNHNDILGLWGDKGFVFVGSNYEFLTSLKLLWRYGWDIVKLQKYTADLLSKFERIYDLQHKLNCYETVNELMNAISPTFLQYLYMSAYNSFKSDGFSDKIIDEIIFATLRCNYGQTTSVNKFVGSVSVAGAGAELFSIKGGNKLLPQKLLAASEANLILSKVDKITKDGSQYVVTSTEGEKLYDIAVVATPLTEDQKNKIEINIPHPVHIPGFYHKTVCTIVKGAINNSYFGYTQPSDVPDAIITVSEDLFFNSLSKIYPVNGKCKSKKQIWKIFSQEVLPDKKLKILFKNYIVMDTIEWLAYPHYGSEARSDSFVLHENLYYVNAVEWSASAIEMSAIGGKNVALLIYKMYSKIPNVLNTYSHEEL